MSSKLQSHGCYITIVSGCAVWWTVTRWRQVWCVCSVKTVWSIPERFRDELLTMGRYKNLASFPPIIIVFWTFSNLWDCASLTGTTVTTNVVTWSRRAKSFVARMRRQSPAWRTLRPHVVRRSIGSKKMSGTSLPSCLKQQNRHASH